MPTDDLPHLTPAERERWRVAHAASAGTWVKTEMTNDYDGIWEEDVWDINAIDGDCTTLIADMGKRGIEVVTANADHVILNQPATVIATLREINDLRGFKAAVNDLRSLAKDGISAACYQRDIAIAREMVLELRENSAALDHRLAECRHAARWFMEQRDCLIASLQRIAKTVGDDAGGVDPTLAGDDFRDAVSTAESAIVAKIVALGRHIIECAEPFAALTAKHAEEVARMERELSQWRWLGSELRQSRGGPDESEVVGMIMAYAKKMEGDM